MDELEKLKSKMEKLESHMEEMKAEYKALKKAYELEKMRPGLNQDAKNLEEKIKEQRQCEHWVDDQKLLKLLEHLEYTYERLGEKEKAEKVSEEYKKLLKKQDSEEYQKERIKFLEKLANSVYADSSEWLALGHAYEKIGEEEKAKHAFEEYYHLYGKECNDGSFLRY